MVPFGHAECLAEAIPTAQAHLSPAQGRGMLGPVRDPDILDELTVLAAALTRYPPWRACA
jgi:hypothetical protein